LVRSQIFAAPAKLGDRFVESNISTINFFTASELREALQELTRELAEWRLAEYLSRPDLATVAPESFTCKVLHSGGKPILFLPDRAKHPKLPAGSDGIQGVKVYAFGDPIDQPNYRGY
jgi:hypothetical protein